MLLVRARIRRMQAQATPQLIKDADTASFTADVIEASKDAL